MSEFEKKSWTIPEVLRIQAERYGARQFCTFEDGGTLTFEELEAETSALASALADLGVEPGDRVAAMLHNSRDFLVAMIGTHKRGGIFVPLNTELKGAFLGHQLSNTAPRVVFLNPEFRPAFTTVSFEEIPVAHTIAVDGESEALPGTTGHSLDALRAVQPRAGDIAAVTRHDIGLILFTSGTTGPSKGVMMPYTLSHLYALGAVRHTMLTEQDRMFISMPLFHGTGLLLQFYSALVAGASVHIVKRFSASSWLDDIRSVGATVTYAVGVMPEFIFQQPARDDDVDNPLRLIWAVPVADRWGREFERRFDLRILQGYGMTEFGLVVWGDLKDPVQSGCAGRVFEEFYELRIVDPETDEPLGPNEAGEIVVRPKEPSGIMAGYYRMPEKTVEASRNLWLHSGDAGYLDNEGRLFFIDRVRDRIRRRGENISSYEVEQVLNSHPNILESAVVAVKVDGAGGEDEIKACVVSHGEPPDPVALLDWCVPRMPRYAVPRYIEYVAELERTPSGKIRKQALRDAGITAATWDREDAGYVVPR